jgi:hypothetical protein
MSGSKETVVRRVARDTHKKAKETADNGARRAVLEDLFYDFHKRRGQVYWTNFARGIFFGIGSVLGGTVVLAGVAWFLSLFVDLPGGIGNFIQYIVDTVNQSKPE